MKESWQAVPATAETFELAEGPVWDGAGERVLWVDISHGRVLEGRLRGDKIGMTADHRFTGTAAAAVPTVDGGLLVALRSGFATIAGDGSARTGPPVLSAGVDSRFNDGACDPGRPLPGRQHGTGRTPGAGAPFPPGRHGGDQCGRRGGFTLSNGLGWAPDGRRLYHVDSVPGIVWSRSYQPGTCEVGPPRARLHFHGGAPDGLSVDVDGNLWVAVWGAGEVRCYGPAAGHLATVEVPAPHTSSAAFVGPARDRLLITTARKGLSEADLAVFPDSGRLFLADVGTAGVPTTPWAGRCSGGGTNMVPLWT